LDKVVSAQCTWVSIGNRWHLYDGELLLLLLLFGLRLWHNQLTRHYVLQVAIKRLARQPMSWSECVSLAEVKSLQAVQHCNIVRLLCVNRTKDGVVELVFEFFHRSLLQALNDRKTHGQYLTRFTAIEITSIMYQILAVGSNPTLTQAAM
jgi:hypothetical protein